MTLINNRNRMKQILSFDGMRRAKIYPSDIDAVLEFRNKYLILFEVKTMNAEIPIGQRMMLERIADTYEEAGKIAVVVHAVHDLYETSEDILLKNCGVKQIYYKGTWRETTFDKVDDFIDSFLEKQNLEL